MNGRTYILPLALGLLPLALTIGCDKQSKEDIKAEAIAEYEAEKAAQDRVAKLEQELADLKSQAADEELQKSVEKQIADANKQAQQAAAAAAARPKGDSGSEGTSQQATSVLTVPGGTKLPITVPQMTTSTVNAGDSWSGSLADSISVDGQVIWPAGTRVGGVVSQSAPTGRLSNGDGALAIRLTEIGGLGVDGGIYTVTVDSKGSRNTKVIGGTALLGAAVGALTTKKNQTDKALGGAAIGAAVGTGIAAATANTTVTINAGTVSFALQEEVRIVKK
jgi:hypothetical protein